jgi:hypothetical protein
MGRKKHTGETASGDVRFDRIALTHGQALWVLRELGFSEGSSAATFNDYIKSLRKLGSPFERGKLGFKRRGLANYTYYHLMELALVLTVRVYYVVPDAVLREIVRHREQLYQLYRRAHTAHSKAAAPITVALPGHNAFEISGLFLDLGLKFSAGRLVSFGPPRLLEPFEALRAFAKSDQVARALLPINLSTLADRVISAAIRAPIIKRGPRQTTGRTRSDRSNGT